MATKRMKKILIVIVTIMIANSNLLSQDIKTLDGKNVSINNVIDNNKPTLVLTFTLWNGPSIKYLKNAASIYSNYSGNHINVVAIALDMKRTSVSRLLERCKEWPFETYICEDNSINDYLFGKRYPGERKNPDIAMAYRCYKDNNGQIIVNRAGILKECCSSQRSQCYFTSS